MRVSAYNDVKIYNLSAGKSLPEWISSKLRKRLEKQDVDLQRRIELIQDLDMPDVSGRIKISKDGKYLITTGTYKPRIRCYEFANLGLKFERCMDAEIRCMEILSDDYSKICMLCEDRNVEFHTQQGRYYRFRVPRVCLDMAYLPSTCDQYFVGPYSSQIYRYNLEQGRFLTPLDTLSSGINCMSINPEHNLICVGTVEGKIEAWDPRYRTRVGILDCGLQAIPEGPKVSVVPAVTSLAFRDGLNMGVGTSTGMVLMYDLRAAKPKIIKEHMYELPIKKLDFNTAYNNDFVLSMDAQSLKIWDRETGKNYANIESQADFNDVCFVKDSGLLFLTNDQPKIQTYYLPSLGPAPKFASFLDGLTEELEEDNAAAVYDDYKFVTLDILEQLGLDHLIGTQLMRAHMHGYYMDVRLYRKAVSSMAPNRTETMKKDFIKNEVEKLREKRVKVKKDDLPDVNKDLFMKLKSDRSNAEGRLSKKKFANAKKKAIEKMERSDTILKDERFSKLFTEKDFQVDETEEAYKLLNPAVKRMNKKMKEPLQNDQDHGVSDAEDTKMEEESDVEDRKSEDEDMADSSDEEQELENDKEVIKALKLEKARENIEKRKLGELTKKRKLELKQKLKTGKQKQFKVQELKNGMETKEAKKKSKLSLESRIGTDEIVIKTTATLSGHTATFQLDKPIAVKEKEEKAARHLEERKEARRSVKNLKLKKLPKNFWSK